MRTKLLDQVGTLAIDNTLLNGMRVKVIKETNSGYLAVVLEVRGSWKIGDTLEILRSEFKPE